MFSDITKLTYSINNNFQNTIDFKLNKSYSEFSNTIDVKEVLKLFVTDVEFDNLFHKEIDDKSYYSSTENKFYNKYMNMSLSIYKQSINFQ